MAYYTALIAHWPSISGATTAIKLAALNAEIVTGSIPTVFSVTATDLYNAFDAGEWHSLAQSVVPATVALVARVKEVLALPGAIPVGSGTIANLYLFNLFASSPATLALLGALAVAQAQPWWKVNGYPRAFDLGDISAAGLS